MSDSTPDPAGPEPLPILLLNGPNLNTLGTREPAIYGSETLDDVVDLAERTASELGFGLRAAQTNHEGQMIDWIHEAVGKISGIVINPGGWTHTSVALADALVVPGVPIFEVHISNVHKREAFRHHSYVSPLAAGVIAGYGIRGYEFAIRRLAEIVD
ncbi:type II 3-dehydroquinate dehydratase [Gordonia rubripertincta]|uniref:3-dehydroquinate dehydratase n=2 Tax=Gordonia rubripertincta TaxID=36822 RepID=A0AAW4GB44_GORRU|nr:type II 3-dehydroquinate dehydratase [Gordonia rubripertincta]MBM7280166.1 type II 3-dehydroquinate dehydratase [Gordonia rubripertincta]MDG6780742.1 type II 3-dehydroquinate dehydratase [Gordonia rubripertincta]NKY63182.1 type II 3-dehydroquinate dehydratase [Gordonia rubripertincta]QMU21964.1 type II 3-dehydroquinate dehydratase [Gordonia rubripertincta]GAB86341.1 3-dehydroquinate dehydratase [Gordonia rubripertincta NBRC 101908]